MKKMEAKGLQYCSTVNDFVKIGFFMRLVNKMLKSKKCALNK